VFITEKYTINKYIKLKWNKQVIVSKTFEQDFLYAVLKIIYGKNDFAEMSKN